MVPHRSGDTARSMRSVSAPSPLCDSVGSRRLAGGSPDGGEDSRDTRGEAGRSPRYRRAPALEATVAGLASVYLLAGAPPKGRRYVRAVATKPARVRETR